MRVAIVGAGIAGLSAAYDLARGGHTVVVYESAAEDGGLASGFRDERWEWPLERFYHHLFESDKAIAEIAKEIGVADRLIFHRPVTAQWWRGRAYPIDGPMQVLAYPGMPPIDRVRLGAAVAYLKYLVRDWRPLERVTAADWTRRWVGRQAFDAFFGPLLAGKFDIYAEEVNMAWLWARFKARSFRLGYFEGGFQAFVDALATAVIARGGTLRLATPVQQLQQQDGWQITAAGATESFDAVIVTGAPGLLSRLAPQLPPDYLGRLRELRSMGAVVLTIALRRPLTQGTYWINLPKREFPFLALVEHTSLMSPAHYGGDHLIYCGDYLDPSHEYFRLSQDELLKRFLPALKQVNPEFTPDWVRTSWLHREVYAQPIVTVGHSKNIPPLSTPLAGLYWASMSQVYPWDRGTNFAVELGRRVAREALESMRDVRADVTRPAH